mgnify:CR=1 FL=1
MVHNVVIPETTNVTTTIAAIMPPCIAISIAFFEENLAADATLTFVLIDIHKPI